MSSRVSRRPRWSPRPAGGEPAATSAVSRPSSHTSCARRSPSSWPRRRVALRRDRTTARVSREPRGRCRERAADHAHRGHARRGCAVTAPSRRALRTPRTWPRRSSRHAQARRARAACGVALNEPGERVRIGVDQDLAERILHPVVENACRYGRSAVRVTVAREGSTVLFSIDDDGPVCRGTQSRRRSSSRRCAAARAERRRREQASASRSPVASPAPPLATSWRAPAATAASSCASPRA